MIRKRTYLHISNDMPYTDKYNQIQTVLELF